MVRVAGLSAQKEQRVEKRSDDGMSVEEQLSAVDDSIKGLQKDQQAYWADLQSQLVKEKIHIIQPADLQTSELNWLEDYFDSNMFPVLTPLSMDLAHPFPFISNLGHALIFELAQPNSKYTMKAFVRMPLGLENFVKLPQRSKTELHFISIEDIIVRFIDKLFPGYEATGHGSFRVIRDSDLEVEEEAEDLVLTFESALKRRRRGKVVRIETDTNMPQNLSEFIVGELNLSDIRVEQVGELFALNNLMKIASIDRPDLKFPPFIRPVPGTGKRAKR
ncbi:Polyphosphate kinase [Nymphon striatum]|nr:Polyphosphate kinase [Nymphon striatum]